MNFVITWNKSLSTQPKFMPRICCSIRREEWNDWFCIFRQEGIHIYAIGIGLGDDLAELQGIANKPSEDNVFTVEDFDQLEDLREKVITTLSRPCEQNCGKDDNS